MHFKCVQVRTCAWAVRVVAASACQHDGREDAISKAFGQLPGRGCAIAGQGAWAEVVAWQGRVHGGRLWQGRVHGG
eukprot:4051002-Prorocentrum_lima.AAC.1